MDTARLTDPDTASSRYRPSAVTSTILYLAVAAETLGFCTAIPNAFTVPKAVAALVGAALLAPFVFQAYGRGRLRSAKPLAILFGIQFLILSASTFLSTNPQLSFWGGDWRRMGLLTWVAILVAAAAVPAVVGGAETRWTRFLRAITAVGALAAGYGILQWFNLDPFLPAGLRQNLIEEFGGVFRVIGPIGQPTYFANCLLYPLFAALGLLRYESNGRRKWWNGFCVVLISSTLLLTMSRGAILGAGAGLILLLLLTRKRLLRKVWVPAGVLLSLFLLLGPIAPSVQQVQSRIASIGNDHSDGGRLRVWKDVLTRLLPRYGLQGTGLGMFRPAFARVRSDNYSTLNPDVHWESPHNILLDRWAEQGIGGALVLLILVGVALYNLGLAFKRAHDAQARWAIAGILSGFVAALISSGFNGEVIPTTFYLYLWIALSFATRDCFAGNSPVSVTPRRRVAEHGRRVAFGFSFALSLLLLWHAGNNWNAETLFAKAMSASQHGDSQGLIRFGKLSAESFPEKSVYALGFTELLRDAVNSQHSNTPNRRHLAALAIDYGLRATNGDKPMIAYEYIAEMGALLNDRRTEQWLRVLIAEDPYWFRPHRLLASLELQKGEFRHGENEAQQAAHLAPYDAASGQIWKRSQALQAVFTDDKSRLIEQLRRIPLVFEANRGQAASAVDFLARGSGYSVLTTSSEAVLSMPGLGQAQTEHVHLELSGANRRMHGEGLDEQTATSNYFVGSDPARWKTGIPTFARVIYRAVYPGIDLVYYGNQEQLEYDFVVSPGADPSRVAFVVGGDVSALTGDSLGNLDLRTGSGTMELHRPRTYQRDSEGDHEIPSHYVVAGRSVRFQVGEYDRTRPLIIDPVLIYSTYLGGSGVEHASAIALDASGNTYIVGQSTSVDFPLEADQTFAVTANAYIAKLNPSGSGLVYSTFLGGSNGANATGVAVDASGNAYITGDTVSSDFPVAGSALGARGGGSDAFVLKLDSSGSALMYSGYLGGSGNDFGSAIAVDASGSAVVTGRTFSTDFPTVNAEQVHSAGNGDAFVTKIVPDGSMMLYSTYLGGSGQDQANAIASDASGSAYLTGATFSTDFPGTGAFLNSYAGSGDAFAVRLDISGSALLYSTYLGGSDDDEGNGIAIDGSGNAYITGVTSSADFPLANPWQASIGGAADAFVTAIRADATALLYSTYIGGSGDDHGSAIAIDGSSNAYIAGWISSDWPMMRPIQSQRGGLRDALVAKLNHSGSVTFSTYLGGSADDSGTGIAVDPYGKAYISGETFSTDFPAASPLQSGNHGESDAFIATVETAPAITGINPSASELGAVLSAEITGTDLTDVTAVVFSGTGVTATIKDGRTSTILPLTVTITPGADVGPHTVAVTYPDGVSQPFTGFTVKRPQPVVTGISPSSGNPGTTVPAVIAGTNLTGVISVSFSGTGATAAPGSGGTATSLPVNITVAADAQPGTMTVSVTTLDGTSNAFAGFTVPSTNHGSWTPLTNEPPVPVSNCLLLTDGRVICQQTTSGNWYALTPAITGSYRDGTWARIGSLQPGYAPLYYSSAVLPDGRVIVMGGEYECSSGQCVAADQVNGSIYAPVSNTWTAVQAPAGWTSIGDASAIVLPDGTYLQSDCCSSNAAALNTTTMTWTSVPGSQLDNYYNEEGWVLLPNGSVLTVDLWSSIKNQTERFNPATGSWISAGVTPNSLGDNGTHTNGTPAGYEIGPGILRPDGTVFWVGAVPEPAATAHTAIYNTATDSWSAGPDIPNHDGANDAPAAVLPNGNVLIEVAPASATDAYGYPSRFYEFDGTNLSLVDLPTDCSGSCLRPAYSGGMLVLPTGEVLLTDQSNSVALYASTGTANPAWLPTIISVPGQMSQGGSYTISGTQFNGLGAGASYGDDQQSATNYPLVRITNRATGHVVYARTHNHSTMAVATGGATVSTKFDLPAGIETGVSDIEVVANGLPSAKTMITIVAAAKKQRGQITSP